MKAAGICSGCGLGGFVGAPHTLVAFVPNKDGVFERVETGCGTFVRKPEPKKGPWATWAEDSL